ncbi:M23 family metallopeptidase [Solwaraspora sp. WMMA2059]|uniref:M23 family metallopeptidase n=1 Tax=Solwaraspora sp. WMMA2059 TaxID=3015160 RepID=UPI00248B419D|nr:M23 family metallopeptidase [Solwaraspora sp. WMMA2059]WBB96256.1 M23 family metallopeptidase [Solwaraspora sp. WMMA2059]
MSHPEPTERSKPSTRRRPPGLHRLVPPGRHAQVAEFGRRTRTAALTVLAVAALGIGGAATALNSAPDPTATDPATTSALADRADAAGRADRSTRQPTATPDSGGDETGFGAAPTDSSTSRAEETGQPADPAEAADDAPTRTDDEPAGSADANSSDDNRDSGDPATTSATAAQPSSTAGTADWVTPMPGAQITSCYGQRWGVLHAGIDLALPAGTPVLAAGAGTVQVAGWAYTGYGISVVIDHGGGVLTHYAHLSATSVSVGDRVAPGDTIGAEGSTGDSTGPHLHFEVHIGGLWSQVDPAPWMRERGVDLGC